MKKEQILDFTRRLTQCNRGEMVVIMYDIFFAYVEDAKAAFAAEDWDEYKEALRRAQRMADELITALDFQYELAKNLYSIYVFCRDSLAKAMYKRELSDIELAERLMRRLQDGFVHAAKADTSAPLMKNTQQVYAGYTYGRDNLVETCPNSDRSRGFLV